MKYPIGIQSFETLRRDGYVYDDKTDLVDKLALAMRGHGRAILSCRLMLSLCLSSLLLTSCCMIDEDRSDCGKEIKIDYEMMLVTNMSIEIANQLGDDDDQCIAAALRQHLSNVFTDFAHDIDLSFYDVKGDSARLFYEQHIMDAAQRSYSITLPVQDYMHLALANIQDNRLVSLSQDDRCHSSQLAQTAVPDTIEPHNTGLFTARQPIKMQEDVDQTFKVRLYMANCAAALVLDPRGIAISNMKVYATGFASDYQICDSSYVFAAHSPVIRSSFVENDCGNQLCFCTVNFPSREVETPSLEEGRTDTRTVIETVQPFIAQPGEKSLWEFHAYVTLGDGKTTETILRVKEPLRAGQLKIIKCYLLDDGSVVTNLPEVGISVTLDWKPGNTFYPEI